MIELVDFCKTYTSKKNTFKVSDVNIKIGPGKITALLGPNGSGKSTIMNSICGFIYPTSGKILLTEEVEKNQTITLDIGNNPEFAMKYIGYVPEIAKLPADFTVIDFLKYSANVHNLSGEKEVDSVKRVIKQCFLNKILLSKIKNLSKGQQQRVSFAQALIHNPSNLVLDEPISGLDPSQIKQMRLLIKELSVSKSILMSTHILSEVTNLSSDVYIMSNGKIHKAQNLDNLEKEYLEITENENQE